MVREPVASAKGLLTVATASVNVVAECSHGTDLILFASASSLRSEAKLTVRGERLVFACSAKRGVLSIYSVPGMPCAFRVESLSEKVANCCSAGISARRLDSRRWRPWRVISERWTESIFESRAPEAGRMAGRTELTSYPGQLRD